MSNPTARVIGSAIIVAGGVIALSIGSIPGTDDTGGLWGGAAVFVGGLLFAVDWAKSWRQTALSEQSSDKPNR